MKTPTQQAKPKNVAPPEQAVIKPASRWTLPLLVVIGISLGMLIIYLLTLSPTLNFIDSGELITVAATAGIAHPPGYPLYTLLTIVGAALPLGDAAVGVNLISALSGALAVGLFYAMVYELISHYFQPTTVNVALNLPNTRSGRRDARAYEQDTEYVETKQPAQNLIAASIAAGMALLLGLSVTFWDWATMAKNYTLHYVFVAALFLLALRVRRAVYGAGMPGAMWPLSQWRGVARMLVLLAAILGLAFTNHPMSVLMLPTLAIILFWPQNVGSTSIGRTVVADAPLWRWILKYSPWLVLAGIVPFVIYLYLPIRSSQQPILNWGSPDTIGDFWRHITLWQSSTLLGKPQGSIFDYIGKSFNMYFNQLGAILGLILLALATAGIVRLARTALPFLAASGVLVLLTLYQTYGFQNAEVAAYSVPMYMMVLAWAGVGLYWSVVAITRQIASREQGEASNAWLAIIPAVLVVLALVLNFGKAGHTNDHLTDAYIHNQFKNFAPNALVITNDWYLVSASYYMQYVKHERTDVAVLDRKLLQYPFYMDYATKQYPDIMAQVSDTAQPFAQISRDWVDGKQIDAQRLSTLYFTMMQQMISRNMATRPVYLVWDDPGQEEQYIAQGLATHPEGFGLRVDAQATTAAPPDPQFDYSGILTNVVSKDDIAPVILSEYPTALDRLAAFAQQNNHTEDAARYTDQANQVRRALGLAAP